MKKTLTAKVTQRDLRVFHILFFFSVFFAVEKHFSDPVFAGLK
jgi:hypothetical protein